MATTKTTTRRKAPASAEDKAKAKALRAKRRHAQEKAVVQAWITSHGVRADRSGELLTDSGRVHRAFRAYCEYNGHKAAMSADRLYAMIGDIKGAALTFGEHFGHQGVGLAVSGITPLRTPDGLDPLPGFVVTMPPSSVGSLWFERGLAEQIAASDVRLALGQRGLLRFDDTPDRAGRPVNRWRAVNDKRWRQAKQALYDAGRTDSPKIDYRQVFEHANVPFLRGTFNAVLVIDRTTGSVRVEPRDVQHEDWAKEGCDVGSDGTCTHLHHLCVRPGADNLLMNRLNYVWTEELGQRIRAEAEARFVQREREQLQKAAAEAQAGTAPSAPARRRL